ncbi:MAG: UDP-3-O-acyl-N-acetylglucosamine deacetylase [bacterium]
MRQATIKKGCSLSGYGIHSGEKSLIKISPTPINSGIVFLRNGLNIPALVQHVSATTRGTTLGEIAVVEHLLAAISGLGIDNLLIEVDGLEIPSLDGSALPFVEALSQSGIVEQDAEKNYLALTKEIVIGDKEAQIAASPYNGFKVDFMINLPGIGQQQLGFEVGQDDFSKAIAPARTFGYIEDHEQLKSQGLGQGASLENALVLSKAGYVNKSRFPDEPVRHKILDLIGDLALLGKPLKAQIKAAKSGHRLNIELVRRLLKND